ncbi:uncharacterized protein [Dermacentor albipictus]|uniref:uncharacterized protein n=1 Tax=Dermacentor albipictus TaxID=60249 RepID=UPI0038FC676A
MESFLDDVRASALVDTGAVVIRPSNSPCASIDVLVTKKHGSVRFYADYRSLGKITRKDVYLLPDIDSLQASQKFRGPRLPQTGACSDQGSSSGSSGKNKKEPKNHGSGEESGDSISSDDLSISGETGLIHYLCGVQQLPCKPTPNGGRRYPAVAKIQPWSPFCG